MIMAQNMAMKLVQVEQRRSKGLKDAIFKSGGEPPVTSLGAAN
jgi:hypothetical protein